MQEKRVIYPQAPQGQIFLAVGPCSPLLSAGGTSFHQLFSISKQKTHALIQIMQTALSDTFLTAEDVSQQHEIPASSRHTKKASIGALYSSAGGLATGSFQPPTEPPAFCTFLDQVSAGLQFGFINRGSILPSPPDFFTVAAALPQHSRPLAAAGGSCGGLGCNLWALLMLHMLWFLTSIPRSFCKGCAGPAALSRFQAGVAAPCLELGRHPETLALSGSHISALHNRIKLDSPDQTLQLK